MPEEGALPVVACLLDWGLHEAALELIAELQPWMARLRFYPRLVEQALPPGPFVRLETVATVAERLAQVRPQPQVAAMTEALSVWTPLFDRLVALWLSTVEGEAPHWLRDGDGQPLRSSTGQPRLAGGWPCRRWPADWSARRAEWLADYRKAVALHHRCGKHADAGSSFAQLRAALVRCFYDSSALTGREVGRLRQLLAGAVAKRGPPASPTHEQLRRAQAELAARPRFVDLAALLRARVLGFPAEGGLPSLAAVAGLARTGEHPAVPVDTAIPAHLLAKAERAVEAPVAELVARGVIASGEVLAQLLPQLTARIVAASLEDAALRGLFEQIYRAFRRRRSLLLLDLQRQVQLEELPWIAALEALRSGDAGDASVAARARQALEQAALLALSSFPQFILPNPLIREFATLAKQAKLELPLVEEVAADIFMGTFTRKWSTAALCAARMLEDSLYARYYDLPAPSEPMLTSFGRGGARHLATGFAALCRQRAREAQHGRGSSVTDNGAVLEQSQILTTHNLAVLVAGLALDAQLRPLAPRLAAEVFAWILRRHSQRVDNHRAQLRTIKNTAYAWRQAIFLLSLVDEGQQQAALEALARQLAAAPQAVQQRLAPVYAGLRRAVSGRHLKAPNPGQHRKRTVPQRFLGWSVGPHWMTWS